jgi:transcriptional regulator with XRE-family HTH domain
VADVTYNATQASDLPSGTMNAQLSTNLAHMRKKSATIQGDTSATDEEIRKDIGRRVAGMRQKLKLSARVVAEKLGMSREAVTHIEQGRNNISAVSLWKLATLFDCDLADFFPVIPDGYALTKVDQQKIEQEGGQQATQWAQRLFPTKATKP